jgi:hypothetical protein
MATVPDSSKNSPVLVDPHIPSFSTGMQAIVEGEGIVVDATDPYNPIVSISVNILDMLDNMVLELVEGANVTIDNTDPQRPIISATGGGGGGGIVESVDAGTGIDVDGTDPTAPVVSLSQETLDALGLAETALQSSDVGSAAFSDAADFATATQGGKADTAIQAADLATVATSGSYDDLIDKPTIPAAQVQSDWDAVSGIAAIKNKPTLGTAASQNTTAFATAAQGSKADTALQPGDVGTAAYADTSAFATSTQGSKADTALQAGAIGTSIQAYDSVLDAMAALTLAGNAGKVVKVNATGNGFVLEEADGGGGMKSIQTGYASTDSAANGTSPDDRYFDVTIAAVADVNKCFIQVYGAFGGSASSASLYTSSGSGFIVPRLTSATNLRLSCANAGAGFLRARWFVMEFE